MLPFLLSLSDESDHAKIEKLYNDYHDFMIKFAAAKFKSMKRSNYLYDAEDAVQNAFIKLAKHVERVDLSRGERDVKNYCFAVLNNEIYEVLNENQENKDFDEAIFSVNDQSFVDELEMRENYDSVVAAIKAMDTKYSTALQLFFCREMSPKRIAELMGIPKKTVYTRIARGKKLLLESLKGVD